MADQSSSAWPVICGVLAVIAAIASTAAIMLFLNLRNVVAGQDNWRRRWEVDSAEIAKDYKLIAQKIADESYARVKAESQVAALQAQIDDLKQQLTDAQHKAKPAP